MGAPTSQFPASRRPLGRTAPAPEKIRAGAPRAAIAAYQGHMASDGVVQADRDAAALVEFERQSSSHADDVRSGKRDGFSLVQAFAAHRRAAAGKDQPVAWLYRPWADDDLWLCQIVEPQGEGYAEKRALYATPQPDPRDALIIELKDSIKALLGHNEYMGVTFSERVRMAQEAVAKEASTS